MLVVEAFDRAAQPVVFRAKRERPPLALIAHLDEPADLHLSRSDAVGGESIGDFLLELRKGTREVAFVDVAHIREPHLAHVVPDVHQQAAERRHQAGVRRHESNVDLQLVQESRGMEGPGAAEADEDESRGS